VAAAAQSTPTASPASASVFVSGHLVHSVGDAAADALGLPHGGGLPRLYRNNGDGTFSDVTHAARLDRLLLAMGANYGDLDNDGWLDFYVGTGNPDLGMLLPDRMFRNAEGRFFQDVTTSGGFGHLQKGHGVSFGDLDNDGDQDIYHVVGGAVEADHFRNALFENPGHGNHWIALELEGVTSNHAGIGARIKILVETADGERAIFKTVRSGGSFGASPLRQEIGLGAATRILRVEVRWRSGGTPQILEEIAMDQQYIVREEEAPAAPMRLASFRLGKSCR
jgi:ASPIC and UnbV/FG-GAP-like repeat